ncbi:TPA: hypothetical protein ROI13_001625 [Escherichia coli]|uniref:Uncharacterized protein n=1 Tax=Citrobacter freundii TaxID=546 RepID=A0A9P3Z9A2_CITFR|nr:MULTISPECIES: hypothetical protein [Enterobacteriaceae]ECH0718640.1 hypothetical protein [Salmonella enterica]MBN4810448.1 hypothetical protein [Citrobacter braakii]MBN4815446.1 hypothetical protein [Citrobacter braakii]MBN4824946.1 hypothetical protein [Citrobacter braakii]MBN4839499.1 hypothetical protein [Citrobacter braakii]
MKHENVNTIIAVAGLGLAAFSTFMQFKPQQDILDIVVTADNSDNRGFFLKGKPLPDEIFGDSKILAGPYNLFFEISNNINRPVTIKGVDIKLLDDKGSPIDYRDTVYSESDKKTLTNPVQYEPHTVKRFNVAINIPIVYGKEFNKCFHPTGFIVDQHRYFGDIRFCYYSEGVDFFGNKVNSRVLEGGGIYFTKDESKYLNYKVTVVTGDNTIISKVVTIRD